MLLKEMAGGAAFVLSNIAGSVARSDCTPCNHRLFVPLRAHVLPHSFFTDARSHLGSMSLRQVLYSRSCPIIPKRFSRGLVQASLFGVGAPEALVIGVVALLVFGPRGLAEVARTLGKSLRAFQPTIRELQQISRDFKDTLEQEIGLDELRSMDVRPPPPTYKSEEQSPSSTTPSAAVNEQRVYSRDDYLRATEEQAKALVPEQQRKASEEAAWGGAPPVVKSQAEEKTHSSVEEPMNNAGRPQ